MVVARGLSLVSAARSSEPSEDAGFDPLEMEALDAGLDAIITSEAPSDAGLDGSPGRPPAAPSPPAVAPQREGGHGGSRGGAQKDDKDGAEANDTGEEKEMAERHAPDAGRASFPGHH